MKEPDIKTQSEDKTRDRILLVEDEVSLAVGLEYNLKEDGYEVVWVEDGRKALQVFETESFDLVILDVMMPYFNGFEVAEKIRQQSPQMPVLILTARSDVKDRVRGLSAGADDYLTKPFHLEELLLRIRGMLRRKQWYRSALLNHPVITLGKYQINFEDLTCRSGDQSFQLTNREAMVLKYLVERKGTIVSRKELLENVWNIDSEIETRTVDNFIARLRKYFEEDPKNPVLIQSVRSIGYMFSES